MPWFRKPREVVTYMYNRSVSHEIYIQKMSQLFGNPAFLTDPRQDEQTVRRLYRNIAISLRIMGVPNENPFAQTPYQIIFNGYMKFLTTSWNSIIDSSNDNQPSPAYDCTLATISPYSLKIEWISIPCTKSYDMSHVLCQRKAKVSNGADHLRRHHSCP